MQPALCKQEASRPPISRGMQPSPSDSLMTEMQALLSSLVHPSPYQAVAGNGMEMIKYKKEERKEGREGGGEEERKKKKRKEKRQGSGKEEREEKKEGGTWRGRRETEPQGKQNFG